MYPYGIVIRVLAAFVRPRKPILRRLARCNLTVYNSLCRQMSRVLFLLIGLSMELYLS